MDKMGINRTIFKFVEKDLERYYNYVKEIANKVINELSKEEKEKILKISDYSGEHFGLGLYIRNNYIYNKIDLNVDADDMSYDIFNEIIEILKNN